jgi:hypothetical protein
MNVYGAGVPAPMVQYKENIVVGKQPIMKSGARQDAPWAQDDSESGEAPYRAMGKQDAPWAQDEDTSVYRQPNNAYGAGVRAGGPQSVDESAPRRVPKGPQGQNAPWAQDDDQGVFRPAPNAYGAGVQAGAGEAAHGRRGGNRAEAGDDVYMAPSNAYGAGQGDGGLQAHLDAKQSARAIRTKMSGAGNVLSWS